MKSSFTIINTNKLKLSGLLALLLATSVMLTACGGGGGGTASMPTTPPTTPAPPTVVVPTTPPAKPAPPTVPTLWTPIETIVRNPTGINDPYYRSTCVPGSTPGGCYTDSNNNLENVLDHSEAIYRRGATAFNRRIQGPRPSDPSLRVPSPPRDVRTAWRDGWTGRGANILVMDDFRAFGLAGNPTGDDDPRGVHGYTVGMSQQKSHLELLSMG